MHLWPSSLDTAVPGLPPWLTLRPGCRLSSGGSSQSEHAAASACGVNLHSSPDARCQLRSCALPLVITNLQVSVPERRMMLIKRERRQDRMMLHSSSLQCIVTTYRLQA